MEKLTARHAAWFDTAVDALCVKLLAAPAVEVEKLEEGSEEPDVVKGCVGEYVTPFSSDTDSVKESS